MLFSTLFFIYVFLAVLAAVYLIFGRNVRVQNIILTVFSLFAIAVLGEHLRWNHLAAFLCLLLAVAFAFLPLKS